MSTHTPVLEIQGLNFRFNNHSAWFFKNLSISFNKGSIHFMRGSNGVGKSTLFRVLQGALEKQEIAEGIIVLDGSVLSLTTGRHAAMGVLSDSIKMVQQKFDTMLADRFSFMENLRMGSCDRYPSLCLLPKIAMMPHLLKRFSINYDTPVHLLSGGQRQILAILMALQKPTKLLLLDEPTAALDNTNAAMVMIFLKELVASLDLTVMIICHDKELVHEYSPHGYYEIKLDRETQCRSIEYVFS